MRQKLCHFISVWCLSTLTEKKLLFEISNIHFSAVCVLESNFRRNIYWTGHCNSRPTSINYEVEFYQRIDETNIHERISLKICQDVNWMRVTFFLPPKSWAAGSVKKSDCDLWGPGLIDLDRLSVIKWSHQCQH